MAKIALGKACMQFCIEWAEQEFWKIKWQVWASWSQAWATFWKNLVTKAIWAFAWFKALDLSKRVLFDSARLADELKMAEISYETMLWSAERAEKTLDSLFTFARETPFEVSNIRKVWWQLLAVWFEAETLTETLGVLGNITAWGNWDLNRLATNLWQVKAMWRLMGRELNDFANNWIPVLGMLSEHLWKTTEEVKDMVSDWDLSFEILRETLSKATQEWGKFFNLMKKQSEGTYLWVSSNIIDTVEIIQTKLWDSFNELRIRGAKSILWILDDINNSFVWAVETTIRDSWLFGRLREEVAFFKQELSTAESLEAETRNALIWWLTDMVGTDLGFDDIMSQLAILNETEMNVSIFDNIIEWRVWLNEDAEIAATVIEENVKKLFNSINTDDFNPEEFTNKFLELNEQAKWVSQMSKETIDEVVETAIFSNQNIQQAAVLFRPTFEHLWSEVANSSLQAIFAIQQAIASIPTSYSIPAITLVWWWVVWGVARAAANASGSGTTINQNRTTINQYWTSNLDWTVSYGWRR